MKELNLKNKFLIKNININKFFLIDIRFYLY